MQMEPWGIVFVVVIAVSVLGAVVFDWKRRRIEGSGRRCSPSP